MTPSPAEADGMNWNMTGGCTSPCSLLTRVCSPCSSCSFSSRDSSSSSTLSWLSSRSFCCRCSVAVACVETCRASASWKHTQPYSKHTHLHLNAFYIRERLKKKFIFRSQKTVFLYLCLQSEDGAVEFRCLLVSGFFMHLQLLQLSLCHPQLLRKSLSVLRLLLQVLLNTIQHNTHSSEVYTVSYTWVSYCPLKVSNVSIKISLHIHLSILALDLSVCCVTQSTSASWILFWRDCWRKLKAYSWVLASTITSRASFTSICTEQGVNHANMWITTVPSIHPSIHPSSHTHLHRSVFLAHGLDLSLHLYHLLPHPLHLVGQLSVGPQQVLIVHQ